MAYGPSVPPPLPDNAEAQRRLITDYIRSAPTAAVTGQGFVNETNTNVLTSIQRNNNKANDDNSQTFSSGSTSATNTSSTTPQKNTIKQGNLNADGAIEPRANILDQYSSYTYSASVYLMSKTQYQRLLRSKKKTINGYNLLFQSGGAPGNVGGTLPPGEAAALGVGSDNQTDYGRNPAFPQDFYIDSITIDNALPGRQTQAAHMVTALKFTVIEPGNITLLDRIYAAVQDMGQKVYDNANETLNYAAAAYLMVIRWYGYDEKGNLVDAKIGADSESTLSDPRAICEKFIPFIIKKINWGVSNKLVTYEFDCAPVGQMVAGGTRRGTVPYDVQLTSATVGELLGGDAVYSTASASAANPGASTTANSQSPGTDTRGRKNAASDTRSTINQAQQRVPARNNPTSEVTPNTTASAYPSGVFAPPNANAATDRKIIKLGLMGAMNEFQQQLVADNIYSRADSYEIVFVPGKNGKHNIRDAVLQIPAGTADPKKQTPTVQSSNTGMGTAASQNANQAFNPETNAMNISSRNWGITAGMQLVQAIDLAIRNSSYISSQALTIYDKDSGTESLNTERTEPMRWFKINMEAEQSDIDRYRNDHSYKIRFIISEYDVPNFDSTYFPTSRFRGVHKSYPYWFTGENTSVLDYTANFNGLYNITVTGRTPQNSAAAELRRKYISSMRDMPKYTYASASTESRAGAFDKGNEIGANAAEYLYSPSDLAKAKIRIIGDPAWIQQGELAGGVSVEDFSYSPFLPDGTINFDAQQVMFEIAWQRPQDYNIATGLADPYKGGGLEARQPLQSVIYQALKVVSEFKQGKFEQTIEGSLFMFPVPSGKNTAAAAVPNLGAAIALAGGGNNRPITTKAPVDTRPTDPANQTAAVEARLGKKNTSQAGAGRGSSDAYKSQLASAVKPFIPGNGSTSNQATAAAAVATGVSTLLPGGPPTSNGQIIGPAFNAGTNTVPGRLNIDLANQALFRNNPQKGARDN